MPGRPLVCLEVLISGERIAPSRAERDSRHKTDAAKRSNSHIGSRYKTHAAKLSDHHLGSRYKTNAAKLSNNHFGSRYKTWRTSFQGRAAGGRSWRARCGAPSGQGFPWVIVTSLLGLSAGERFWRPRCGPPPCPGLPAGDCSEQALWPFVPGSHTNGSGDCWGDCLY